MGKHNRVISITLALLIVAAVATIGYLSVVGKPYDKFTEFYLLGPDGKADDYPREQVVGEEAKVILGIVNQEQIEETYRVEIEVADGATTDTAPITLAYQEKWEQEISFSFPVAGQNQEVQFLLYKNGQEKVYDQLRLIVWVRDVGEKYTEFYILKYPPLVLFADSPTNAIAEIVNHEGDTMSYQLEVWVGEDMRQVIVPIILENGGKVQKDISFAARVRGIYRAKFILREYATREIIRQTDCEVEVR